MTDLHSATNWPQSDTQEKLDRLLAEIESTSDQQIGYPANQKFDYSPLLWRRTEVGGEGQLGELTPGPMPPLGAAQILPGSGPFLFRGGSNLPTGSPSRRVVSSWLLLQKHGHVVRINCGHCDTEFRKCPGEFADVVDARIGQVRLHRVQGADQDLQLQVVVVVGRCVQP